MSVDPSITGRLEPDLWEGWDDEDTLPGVSIETLARSPEPAATFFVLEDVAASDPHREPAADPSTYLMFEERCSGRIDPENDKPIAFVPIETRCSELDPAGAVT